VSIASIVAREGKTSVHNVCKLWIADKPECISFAAEICPACNTPVVGLSLQGCRLSVEAKVPHTSYIADILAYLPEQNLYVDVEVTHTHLTPAVRIFECEQAGTPTYEVKTCVIEAAMLAHEAGSSSHVLRTTHTRSVKCAACSE